jgi:hypothetical protein
LGLDDAEMKKFTQNYARNGKAGDFSFLGTLFALR